MQNNIINKGSEPKILWWSRLYTLSIMLWYMKKVVKRDWEKLIQKSFLDFKMYYMSRQWEKLKGIVPLPRHAKEIRQFIKILSYGRIVGH